MKPNDKDPPKRSLKRDATRVGIQRRRQNSDLKPEQWQIGTSATEKGACLQSKWAHVSPTEPAANNLKETSENF